MHKDKGSKFNSLDMAKYKTTLLGTLQNIEEELRLAFKIPSYPSETLKKIQNHEFFEMLSLEIEDELAAFTTRMMAREKMIDAILKKIKHEEMREEMKRRNSVVSLFK